MGDFLLKRLKSLTFKRFLTLNLLILPYASYISLVGLGSMIWVLLGRFRRLALEPWLRNGLIALTGLMLLSGAMAFNRGEAFLQLANFLPFFLLFGVLPLVVRSLQTLESMAIALVVGSIPISLIAAVEYVLKSAWLPRSLRRTEFVRWVRSAPHKGRAMVMFEHPNSLASYLVLVLGLALGLILHRWLATRSPDHPEPSPVSPRVLMMAAGALLVGIFCTGSRNGLLVAILQLGLFCLLAQASRRVILGALLGGIALVASALVLGLGDRRIAAWDWRNDPRVGVWAIALSMMRDRPWLGWGLGNFKFIYPDQAINPEFKEIFHPHNLWLLLGGELGLPAMLLLTGLIGAIAYRAARPLALGQVPFDQKGLWVGYLLAGFAGLVSALFDVTFYDSRVNVVNWIVLSGLYQLPVLLKAHAALPSTERFEGS
jgi:O-Antigen ligase